MKCDFRIPLSLLCLLLLPTLAAAQPAAQPLAATYMDAAGIEWSPTIDFESAVLTVSGPEGSFRLHYDAAAVLIFEPYGAEGNALVDGQYKYELVFTPRLSQSVRAEMRAARASGDEGRIQELRDRGVLPAETQVHSGSFRIGSGQLVVDDLIEETSPVAMAQQGPPELAPQDFLINDDLIVDGSACIGFDCVNGESFGFDTLRLKENNLRIKFDDTSSAASFPKRDWQLTANASANGGLEKFSIDDITAGRTPFTIEGNAPSHSLYVDDGGRVGLGTSTPAVELVIVDGDTPTLRLQQDGSSGFTPQTWDVAGNETNFFVRDVTNGSKLPLRIRPDAPTSSLFVDADGDVGMNTASPSEALHIRRTTGPARLLVETTSASDSAGLHIKDSNATTAAVIDIEHPQSSYIKKRGSVDGGIGSELWIQFQSNSIRFRDHTLAQDPFIFNTTAGHLTITGDFITDANTYPDYVFEKDYELMGLDELADFIAKEGHLPNVPSQADIDADGGKLRMNELQIKLLEKVEELTLYTLQQQEMIESLQQELQALKPQN